MKEFAAVVVNKLGNEHNGAKSTFKNAGIRLNEYHQCGNRGAEPANSRPSEQFPRSKDYATIIRFQHHQTDAVDQYYVNQTSKGELDATMTDQSKSHCCLFPLHCGVQRCRMELRTLFFTDVLASCTKQFEVSCATTHIILHW